MYAVISYKVARRIQRKLCTGLICAHTVLYAYIMHRKNRQIDTQSAHSQCGEICKWTKLPLWKTLHLSKRSQQELAGIRLFISFFSCPSLFFSRIFFPPTKFIVKRILEANIRGFVWRLVKEKKNDERMSVYVWSSMLWPFADSQCRVNVIMTSRDAICFLGSRVIQPLWGFKRSRVRQHQQLFYVYS